MSAGLITSLHLKLQQFARCMLLCTGHTCTACSAAPLEASAAYGFLPCNRLSHQTSFLTLCSYTRAKEEALRTIELVLADKTTALPELQKAGRVCDEAEQQLQECSMTFERAEVRAAAKELALGPQVSSCSNQDFAHSE